MSHRNEKSKIKQPVMVGSGGTVMSLMECLKEHVLRSSLRSVGIGPSNGRGGAMALVADSA